MKGIENDYRAKRKDLKKNENICIKVYKLKLAGFRKKYRKRMQALLTVEQKDQLTALKKKRMDKMKIKLGLNDELVAKMKSLHNEMVAQK